LAFGVVRHKSPSVGEIGEHPATGSFHIKDDTSSALLKKKKNRKGMKKRRKKQERERKKVRETK
jgi:hypothetical protein